MFTYPPLTRIANRYEVASRPLIGGMGIVYLCYDHEENRPVALKTFKPEYLSDREARDRFLREGTTWVNLGKHSHIVRAYEVVRIGDGREVFLVLEQIAKEQGRTDASLRSWLTPGKPLPVADSLLIALQVVRGLKHASEKISGFVHRDLKPENILIGADRLQGWKVNRVRVTDFGLAAVLQERSGQLAEGSGQTGSDESQLSRTQLTHGIVGTPLYMAPEQWRGEDVIPQTDMYALGLMLFEMVTGERAVNGDRMKDLEQAHTQGKLGAVPTSLPEGVRASIGRCLRLASSERYGNWGEVEQALSQAYTALTHESVPPPDAPQALERSERVAFGWAQSEMGKSYVDIGKADVARDYFERAHTVGLVEREQQLESVGLNHVGLAYLILGDARRAIGYFEQSLTIKREIGDRQGEGNSLLNLGIAFHRLGDARRAIEYYEQALVIAREISDRHDEAAALGNLGIASLDLSDARRAIEYHEQTLAIAREIRDRRGEGNALGSLGSAYLNLGDARRAIGYYEQALTIHCAIGDRQGEGNSLGNLGSAYKNLGDVRRAIGYYEQQLVITREIGDRHGEGASLGNLGSAYLNFGDAQRAIGYFDLALVIRRETGDRQGEGTDLGNLGSAYLNLGDAQMAIRHFEQAITISREIGDVNLVASSSFNMALLYQQQGDTLHALPLAQEAARTFAQIGHPEYTQRAQQLVAQLQGGAPASASTSNEANAAQAAFESFQRASSRDEMKEAIKRYPIMTDPQFIAAIEKIMKEQVPAQQKPSWQERLDWLKKLVR